MTSPDQNQLILNYLKPYQPERVGIFGSWARAENGPDSDLDILVKLSRPVSLLTFTRMQRELSELLNLSVDLLSEGALHNQRLKEHILKELKEINE